MKLSRLEQSLLFGARGPFLRPDADDSGASDDSSKGNNADSGGKEETKEQEFKPITSEAELSAYKSELRKNIAADLRKSIKAELDADREKSEKAAREKQERDEAEARGEFDKVRVKLEDDLKVVKDDNTRLTAENDQLRTALELGFKEAWADLPESIRKIGERQHDETDIIGRFTFLHDEDTQALVKELTKSEGATGTGRDPVPGGTKEVSEADRRKAQSVMYSQF